MEDFLYFIRDKLVGLHYFIYAFALLFFMFAIIGYLFKQKYAKYDIKLNTKTKKKNYHIYIYIFLSFSLSLSL